MKPGFCTKKYPGFGFQIVPGTDTLAETSNDAFYPQTKKKSKRESEAITKEVKLVTVTIKST